MIFSEGDMEKSSYIQLLVPSSTWVSIVSAAVGNNCLKFLDEQGSRLQWMLTVMIGKAARMI